MIPRFFFTCGLLVCLAIAGVAQDEAKASANNEVDEGVQAFRQAHYDDAIAHFKQAIAFDPDLTMARMYLAATYLQVFQPGIDTPENVVLATSALEQYSEILRNNPSDVESLKGLAYLKLQLNNFDEAKEAYARAIALNPADADLLYAAAVANWSNASAGITAEKAKLDAETEYSLIVSEGCPDVRTRFLPEIDNAIAMLSKAISLRKDYVDAMTYMNMLYRLRAELECGSKKNFKADVKQSDDWADRAAEARKKQAEAAENEDQEKPPDKH